MDDDTTLQTQIAYETYAAHEKGAKEAAQMFISDHRAQISESLKDRISHLVGEDPHFEINGELEISEGHDADAEPEIYQGLLRWDDDQ